MTVPNCSEKTTAEDQEATMCYKQWPLPKILEKKALCGLFVVFQLVCPVNRTSKWYLNCITNVHVPVKPGLGLT